MDVAFEVHKCLNGDSTTISDYCITNRDPVLLAEDLDILHYKPNETLTFTNTLLDLCTAKPGLYKARFIVNLEANNSSINNYYSKWYYTTVNKDLSGEILKDSMKKVIYRDRTP